VRQSEPSRFHSAVESAAELIAIFEAEAEWESAEQTRVLLYHLLRDDTVAAASVLDLLSANRSEWFPGSGSEIAYRLSRLALVLTCSPVAEWAADEFERDGSAVVAGAIALSES